MATFSEDFGISEERLAFTDSSENDRTVAKSFWQSFNLQPHMESTLTCCHVKQRMPICSIYKGSTCTNNDHLMHEQNQEEFLKKLAEARKLDEIERIERYAFIREANRALLERHRQIRIQKEEIALRCSPWKKCPKQKKVQFTEPCPDICDQQEDSKTVAEEMIQDIEHFERNILGMDDDDDSVDECNESACQR